jgi:hypothetical protein
LFHKVSVRPTAKIAKNLTGDYCGKRLRRGGREVLATGSDSEVTTMRKNDAFFERALFYYGSYKGFGAIFGLFFLVFIALPVKLVRLLVDVSRR